jgi:trans-aconitate 2-methyltransferase
MPSWNADQYLKFAEERAQPARDLAARIVADAPGRIVDLGSGPGNSAEILAARWPMADIEGLDSSSAMIEAARRKQPGRRWTVGDIARWAVETDDRFDIVFSNAALQWVPDHDWLYPALFRRVAPAGTFAVQVPANLDASAHRIMRELAVSPRWRPIFPPGGVREWDVHDAGFYYDCLAPLAARLHIWTTEYLQVMEGAAAIVDWYRGTGLRPYLDALPADEDRARFLAEYLAQIARAYPPRSDGRVLFPFRRLFLVAVSPA